MSAGEVSVANTQRADGYRLAWPAYVSPTLQLVVMCGTFWLVTLFNWKAGVICLLLALCRFVYQVLWLGTVELYTDVAGIWVFRGLFPWNRGSYGVRWSDADDAVFHTGMFAWATRSFRIRVRNRFSPRSEIDLAHVYRGNEAVMHINQRQVKERSLDMAVTLHDFAARKDRA
jgi:hypothetical protein